MSRAKGGAGRKRRSTYRTGSTGPQADSKLTLEDMLGEIAESLAKQAAEPNLHAYEPHEKQQQFHKSTAHQKLFIGGNRSGKTVAGITEDLWWVTRRHPHRRIPSDTIIRGRVLGDGFEKGTINEVLIPTMKRWVIPSDLINGSWEDSWNRSDQTLTFANDSFIEFKSYAQDLQRHAGTSRHFIHFDEEPPQSIFVESLLRLVDTAGSWWMTMTPLNGMNWVYDVLYEPGMRGDIKDLLVVQVSTMDNPYITDDALSILLGTVDETDKQQRLHGQFADRGGKVLPEFGDIHLIKGQSWYPRVGSNWRIFMSLDHGINHPTAVYWHAVNEENQVITFGEHYKSDMVVKEHANIIKKFEAEHGLEVFARPADPAVKQRQGELGTSILQAYGAEGIYLNADVPRDVATGLDRMRTYLKIGSDGLPHWRIVEDQCPNLVKELPRLVWESYSSAKQRDRLGNRDQIRKKNDDGFDSARYFFTMMPDLAPDKLWKLPGTKQARQKTYVDVLAEMATTSAIPAWKPSARGFSQDEYLFMDGMEAV